MKSCLVGKGGFEEFEDSVLEWNAMMCVVEWFG